MHQDINLEYLRFELWRGVDDIKDSHALLKELSIPPLIIVVTYDNINVHNLKKQRKKK